MNRLLLVFETTTNTTTGRPGLPGAWADGTARDFDPSQITVRAACVRWRSGGVRTTVTSQSIAVRAWTA
jgi:hypothetical protein